MPEKGPPVKIINGEGVKIASADLMNTFYRRLKGLSLKKIGKVKRPVILYPCSSVHTLLTLYPLDLFFLSGDGSVLRVARNVPPCRFVGPVRGAIAVVEAPSNLFHLPDEEIMFVPGLIEKSG